MIEENREATMHQDRLPDASDTVIMPQVRIEHKVLPGMTPEVRGTSLMRNGDAEADDFTGYYGLSENPFGDCVNPDYFYRTELHDETFIRMKLAIRHKISMAMVTGKSGTGKTLISQKLLKDINQKENDVALILATPAMSKTALLKEILNELSLEIPQMPILRAQDLLKVLQDHIMDLHQNGRRLVMIFDECHFLTSDSLHMIRTISNIETAKEKLSTSLLFGEERLLKRLQHPSYESLRTRMYLRAELEPLTLQDTEQYLKYRTMVAGSDEQLFTYEAMAALHEVSGGICRKLNKLATLCLINGFIRHRRPIDEITVYACAKQM